MSWKFARPEDAPALAAFLRPREWECVNLTSRLRAVGREGFSAGTGRIAVNLVEGRPAQAVYMSRHGLLIPYLPGYSAAGDEGGRGLADIFFKAGGAAASLMGMADYCDAFCSVLDLRPEIRIDYNLMTHCRPPSPVPPAGSAEFSVRRAVPGDLDALLPLQEAYEREEVLVRQDMFDSGRTRAELKNTLASQIVVLAEHRGRVVAKGGTNARGLGYDQIGGVFTVPEFRNRGAGFHVIEGLLFHIFAGGKGACLFVKKANVPAIRLYDRCGFGIAGNYRISYF